MGRKGLIVILLICLAISLVGILLTPSAVSLHDLQAAPKEIEINGSNYTLETYLSRDFMPPCSPDGTPLGVLVTVVAPGETVISSRIDATRLWVVNGEEIWETELVSQELPTVGDALKKMGRGGGPKWGPGIGVDVIVRIIDLNSGKDYLLRASNEYIHRTS